MTKDTVQWRQGSQVPIAAEVAHAEIERIRKAHGGNVTAAMLVETASKRGNKLHGAGFRWDDKEAAHNDRLAHARYILRSLMVVRIESPKYPSRQYEVQRLPAKEPNAPREQVYSTLEDILRDPLARGELLKRALGELIACRRKYHQLQELAIVWRELDTVLETVEV